MQKPLDLEIQSLWEMKQKLSRMGKTKTEAYIKICEAKEALERLEKEIIRGEG